LRTLGRARQSDAGKRVPDDMIDAGMDPVILMQVTNLCAAPFINSSQARVDDSAPDLGGQISVRNSLLARGSKLFAQNCAGCHGANGDGRGPAAAGLTPKPSDLRLRRYSVAGLAHNLWNGVAGSAMPAWRDFPAADLASLTAYVQTLHAPVGDKAPAPAFLLARGAVIYASHCLNCHGAQGDGKGPAAPALLPRPANFTAAQPDTARVLQVLNEGIPGMPSWPGLAPADRQAVTQFVRTLFKSDAAQNP